MIELIRDDKNNIIKLKFKKQDTEQSKSLEEAINNIFVKHVLTNVEAIENEYVNTYNNIKRIEGKIVKNDSDKDQIEKLNIILKDIEKKNKAFKNIEKYSSTKIKIDKIKLNDTLRKSINDIISNYKQDEELYKVEKDFYIEVSHDVVSNMMSIYNMAMLLKRKTISVKDHNNIYHNMKIKDFEKVIKALIKDILNLNDDKAKLFQKVNEAKTSSDILKLF